jgi:hypothetical protein
MASEKLIITSNSGRFDVRKPELEVASAWSESAFDGVDPVFREFANVGLLGSNAALHDITAETPNLYARIQDMPIDSEEIMDEIRTAVLPRWGEVSDNHDRVLEQSQNLISIAKGASALRAVTEFDGYYQDGATRSARSKVVRHTKYVPDTENVVFGFDRIRSIAMRIEQEQIDGMDAPTQKLQLQAQIRQPRGLLQESQFATMYAYTTSGEATAVFDSGYIEDNSFPVIYEYGDTTLGDFSNLLHDSVQHQR